MFGGRSTSASLRPDTAATYRDDDDDIVDTFFRFRVVSFIQLASGVVGFLAGCVALAYGVPNIAVPVAIAPGMWTTVIVVVCGLLGVLSTYHEHEISLLNQRAKDMIVAQYVLSLVSLATSSLYIGLSAWVLVLCSGNGNFPDWCYPYSSEQAYTAIACIAAGALMVVLTLPVLVVSCGVMRVYKELDPDLTEDD